MSQIIDNLTNNKSYKIQIYSFSNGSYDESVSIDFSAFVTDFTDSFKSDWKKENLYGKMDPIATYKNTTRTITLAFDIPSESITEGEQNMRKLDYLIRGLYPIYSSGFFGTKVISSPPMFRVRFANLIRNAIHKDTGNGLPDGLLCYIPNFDFKPKIDSGFYLSDDPESDTKLIPRLLTATLTLEVIHEHPLGNQINGNRIVPRIFIQNTKPFSFPHDVSNTPYQTPPDAAPASADGTPVGAATPSGTPPAPAPAPSPTANPVSDSGVAAANAGKFNLLSAQGPQNRLLSNANLGVDYSTLGSGLASDNPVNSGLINANQQRVMKMLAELEEKRKIAKEKARKQAAAAARSAAEKQKQKKVAEEKAKEEARVAALIKERREFSDLSADALTAGRPAPTPRAGLFEEVLTKR